MFTVEKQIRFHHCDPFAIVFYGQYFTLFNELVEDWFRGGLDSDYADLLMQHGIGFPVGHVECDFLAPSRMGELVRLSLGVKRLGNSSIELRVTITGPDGKVRVKGTLTIIAASVKEKRSVAIPAALRERMAAFLIDGVVH